MTRFGTPSFLVVVAAALAVLVHPGLRTEAWLPRHEVLVTGLALLLVLALLARARAGTISDRLVAGGAVLVFGGLAFDAVRGRAGELLLAPGIGVRGFTEHGPGRRVVGFRPFGFELRLEEMSESGGVSLAVVGEGGNGGFEVPPDRSVTWGGYRFGRPRAVAAPGVFALRLRVAGPKETRELTLAGAATERVGDLDVSVERFFPDFELDERQQPRSRSDELNNPAALLQVRRGERAWRVFVIERFPGLHRQEGLAEVFSLIGVESGRDVRLHVAKQPAALVAATGVVFAALGVALGLKRP